MKGLTTRKIVLNGLMIALVFVTTRFTAMPVANGYFNIGDVAIIVASMLLGRKGGFLAGSIGSALSDLTSPYAFYAPITFVVKGLEGFVMGYLLKSGIATNSQINRLLSILSGILIMLGGYFAADSTVLGLVGQEFGWTVAVTNLLTNLVQGIASVVAGYAVLMLLDRVKAIKTLVE